MNSIDAIRQMKRDWTPDKHITSFLAKNSFGVSVNPDDSNAVGFCAVGMIHKVCGTYFSGFGKIGPNSRATWHVVYSLLEDEVARLYGDNLGLINLNDSPGGYEKIMAAIDNILLREGANQPLEVEEKELVTA